jgi:hypothetical protein
MLIRYARVLFAVLGLLLFDWENPSPDSTLVLDAFDGIADLVEMLDSESVNESPFGKHRREQIQPRFSAV